MIGHGEKLTRKQELAIAALLVNQSVCEAAKQTGVGEATLFRWLQREDFQEAYRLARRQAVGQAITRIQRASSEAVNTLQAVMKDSEATASSRVAAAKTVLEMAIKAVELEDIETRIAELEQKAGSDQ